MGDGPEEGTSAIMLPQMVTFAVNERGGQVPLLAAVVNLWCLLGVAGAM
jgi:hypothetical protein